MPTAKKRINLSVDDRLWDQLQQLKKQRGASSLSAVVIELTKEALEMQEDLYFTEIAKQREDEPTISHEQIWKNDY